jgi:hypothetical protein
VALVPAISTAQVSANVAKATQEQRVISILSLAGAPQMAPSRHQMLLLVGTGAAVYGAVRLFYRHPTMADGLCDQNHPTAKNGIYCGQGMDNNYVNGELSTLLQLFLQGKTVVDIGAGQGGYSKAMKEKGISVRAFDGQVGIEAVTKGLVSRADLTRPLKLEPAPQWTISFEVLEHIPSHLEPAFFVNVVLATEGVIVSCAIVG